MFADETSWCTWGIIAATSIYSWFGFRDDDFCRGHLFAVEEILAGKQYHRMFTSGLLHADFNHLLLNMISLLLFGGGVEMILGHGLFLAVYAASILGGNALSLWIHRHHEYHALGASGGVCGIIFSSIILVPGGTIGSLFLPFGIPAWLYAVLFVIGSAAALRRQADNVGHDAHLGGAIIGFWLTAALEPAAARNQWKLFLTISALAVLLFVFLLKMPLFLPLSAFRPESWRQTPFASKRVESDTQDEELDRILEKISRDGLQSLSRSEKARLMAASKKQRGGR